MGKALLRDNYQKMASFTHRHVVPFLFSGERTRTQIHTNTFNSECFCSYSANNKIMKLYSYSYSYNLLYSNTVS